MLLQTPRGTRSSDLRKTVIDNPSYLSPSVDKLSVSRLSGLTVEEVKKREAVIFQGTPGHRRGLSLKEKEGLWSLRPSVGLLPPHLFSSHVETRSEEILIRTQFVHDYRRRIGRTARQIFGGIRRWLIGRSPR